MSNDDHDILLRVESAVLYMKDRIPAIEANQKEHEEKDDERFGRLENQQSFWKGAIALLGALVVTFGAVVVVHILGGHGQ